MPKFGNVEWDGDVLRRSHFDPATGKMTNQIVQDVEPILEANKASRNATPKTGKYRKTLTLAARIPLTLLEQMRIGTCCTDGIKYDLWSNDVEEKRLALVHAQTYHKDVMAITGTPFTRVRPLWQ